MLNQEEEAFTNFQLIFSMASHIGYKKRVPLQSGLTKQMRIGKLEPKNQSAPHKILHFRQHIPILWGVLLRRGGLRRPGLCDAPPCLAAAVAASNSSKGEKRSTVSSLSLPFLLSSTIQGCQKMRKFGGASSNWWA